MDGMWTYSPNGILNSDFMVEIPNLFLQIGNFNAILLANKRANRTQNTCQQS